MKKLYQCFVGALLAAFMMIMPAKAAEEIILQPVDTVLYSNKESELYVTPDILGTPILAKEDFPDGIPVQVTGITSNGYFQVNVGGVYYIPGLGLQELITSTQNSSTTVSNELIQREKQVYEILIGQKAVFPEGMRFTNEDYFDWQGGIYSGGYGCAGFAFHLSDLAFGDKKAVIHRDYTNLHVGDILRINHDKHSVIILEVKTGAVVVAEANYNSSVHWGRELSLATIQDESSYIMTRY